MPSVGLRPQSWPTGGSWHWLRGQRAASRHTEQDFSVVFSFHSEECNPPPASPQSLPPSHTLSLQDMSPHTGVAITLSPDSDDPGFLTQKPPCSVPFSPFLFREQGRRGGGEERQPLSQKWQHLFKVTSYSHTAERVPVNHA